VKRFLHLAVILASLAPFLAACGTQSGTAGDVSSTARSSAQTAPATGATSTFPMTITDDMGRQIQIKAEPKRIVSAAPSTTEILFALGLGDRVVAVTTFCNYPDAAQSKPKIGGLRPNVESIVAQTPDVVFAVRGTPAEVVTVLEAQAIPVVVLNPSSFAGVLDNIKLVGRLTRTSDTAEKLTGEMQRRWNAVAEKARTAAAKPRVLYELDATDPAAVSVAGAGTFIDAMIQAAGGTNVLAAQAPGQQYPRVNAEAVLQANPEIVILGDAPFGQSLETVRNRPGWNAITAVERRAVVSVSDIENDILSRAGPRLVDGVEFMARAVHPELFK
jgi:iron complex transport system substrate-binding protein